ncbi:MAG TPA: DUF4388 domain-containing protein [Oculatellaceae cyanobacterium]
MLKKTGPATQLQKLPAAPGLPEIHHFLKMALEKRGKHVQVSWFTLDRALEFTLDIISPIKGGDPEWRLYSQRGTKREFVWEYTSCDVLLVYNLTMSSCGELHSTIRAEGQLNVSEFQRDTARNTGKQYMVDIEAAHAEHGKGTMVRDNSWSRASMPIQGMLGNIAMGQLLQSFLPGKATGLLEIRGPEGNSMIWYEEGSPTHAMTGELVGDDAVMATMGWRTGEFKFEPRVKTDVKTVRSIIESLVAQGTQLADRKAYLKSAGIDANSILVPVNVHLTELDFIQKVSRNSPMDIGTLARFYQALDGKKTLTDVSLSIGMSVTQIYILVYHLLICDCIKVGALQPQHHIVAQMPGAVGAPMITAPPPVPTISPAAAAAAARPGVAPSYAAAAAAGVPGAPGTTGQVAALPVEPRNIDSGAIQSVMMSLRRAETGMFIYPAFLYFLEQEYFRSYRSGSPLSVLVFEMRFLTQVGNELVRQILPPPALLDAVGRISTLKRHVDLLAHYDAFDYAMLLPNTRSSGAQIFANRLVKTLTSAPLAGGIDASKLLLSFGSASVPEDFLDLSLLLGAADAAMNKARQTRQPLVMYKEIKEGK